MITHSFSFSYLSFSLKNPRCGLVNRSGDFSCGFRHAVSPIARGQRQPNVKRIVGHIGFPHPPDKLEFTEMRCTIPSPGGKVPQCAHWGGWGTAICSEFVCISLKRYIGKGCTLWLDCIENGKVSPFLIHRFAVPLPPGCESIVEIGKNNKKRWQIVQKVG